ncbi:MAG: hypothetical protein Kow0059_06230 [Candidatus Sumerlaeia bacterium]
MNPPEKRVVAQFFFANKKYRGHAAVAAAACLIFCFSGCSMKGPANRIASVRFDFSGSARQSFRIDDPAPVFQKIVFENTGSSPIRDFWLIVNNKDWSDDDGIADSIRAFNPNATTTHQKIMSLWAFMDHYFYYYTPALKNLDYHDAKFNLNIFGYGFCDDSAHMMEGLVVDYLGYLPQKHARVVALDGHIVPEFYYDNQWHCPDANVAYFSTPQKEALSVAELEGPFNSIITTVFPGEYGKNLAEIYSTKNNNHYAKHNRKHTPPLRWTLLPGQRVEIHRTPPSSHYSHEYPDKPAPRLSGGVIVVQPIEYFPDGFDTVSNITKSDRSLRPAEASAPASVVTHVDTPYLFTGSTIEFSATGPNPPDVIISVSRDGKRWIQLQAEQHSDSNRYRADAGRMTQMRRQLEYFRSLYIQLLWPAGSTTAVSDLKVTLEFQVATCSLPELIKGPNEIRIKSARPESVLAEMQYFSPGYEPRPPTRIKWNSKNNLITWKAPRRTDDLTGFRVTVSSDKSCLWPVQPLVLRKTVSRTTSKFTVNTSFLNPDRPYYFRVDSVYKIKGIELLRPGPVHPLTLAP